MRCSILIDVANIVGPCVPFLLDELKFPEGESLFIPHYGVGDVVRSVLVRPICGVIVNDRQK